MVKGKENTGELTEEETFWVSIGWTKSDSRPSAIATGAGVGILFYVLPLLLVFILDLPIFYQKLRRALYQITGNEKYKSKKETKKKKPEKNRIQEARNGMPGTRPNIAIRRKKVVARHKLAIRHRPRGFTDTAIVIL